jgi:hypothetical protein
LNFKHLANVRRETGFNAVNLLQDYPALRIVAPTLRSMATTKKKTFDAVAASRRWRVQAGRKLRGLTFEQQQEMLRRTTEAFFAGKPKRRAPALAHR